jgi:hypothetical protein
VVGDICLLSAAGRLHGHGRVTTIARMRNIGDDAAVLESASRRGWGWGPASTVVPSADGRGVPVNLYHWSEWS